MSHELKKLAMDAVTGANSVIQSVGYIKGAAFVGVYLAKIREADRERLNTAGGARVINNINIHNIVGNTQGMMNKNGIDR